MKDLKSHQRAVLEVRADDGNVRLFSFQFSKGLSGSAGECVNFKFLAVLLEGTLDELASHAARFGYNDTDSVGSAQHRLIK
jgi:hypothetical protein